MRTPAALLSAAAAVLWLTAGSAAAQSAPVDHRALAERTLEQHVMPLTAGFAQATDALAATADCTAADPAAALRPVWRDAFLAWARLSHLQLGPLEEEGRTLAISLWPDKRGFSRRTVERMVAEQDAIVDQPDRYGDVSVAGRGLMALHYLLYVSDVPVQGYRCRLATAIAADLAVSADIVQARWADPWAAYLLQAGADGNPVYQSGAEATKALFQALMTGFQILVDQRLGGPLGTFDRPRPKRAEAYASGASLDAIAETLSSMRAMAEIAFYPTVNAEAQAALGAAFDRTDEILARIEGPLPEDVASPASRIQVEALKISASDLHQALAAVLGERLGITIGFNALDGD
ncbi:MAG: imelysin family protein [Pseudomonadota bacterium]